MSDRLSQPMNTDLKNQKTPEMPYLIPESLKFSGKDFVDQNNQTNKPIDQYQKTSDQIGAMIDINAKVAEGAARGAGAVTVQGITGMGKGVLDAYFALGGALSDATGLEELGKEFRREQREIDAAVETIRDWNAETILGDSSGAAKTLLGVAETVGSFVGLGGFVKGLSGVKLYKGALTGGLPLTVGPKTASVVTFGALGNQEFKSEAERQGKEITPEVEKGARIAGAVQAAAGFVAQKLTGIFGGDKAKRVVEKSFGNMLKSAARDVAGGAAAGATIGAGQEAADIAAYGPGEDSMKDRAARVATSTLYGAGMVVAMKGVNGAAKFFADGRAEYASWVRGQAAKASDVARKGLPLVKGDGVGGVSEVTKTGEVIFRDGTIYRPATPEVRTPLNEGGYKVVPAKPAEIRLFDGTILNEAGEVVGVAAGPWKQNLSEIDAQPSANIAELEKLNAPAAVKEWMAAPKDAKPQLDAEGQAFMRIYLELYSANPNVKNAAAAAMDRVNKGELKLTDAANLIDEARAGLPEGATKSAAPETPVIPSNGAPTEVAKPQVRPNGSANLTTVRAAETIVNWIADGTIKPTEVDVTEIQVRENANPNGPLIVREDNSGVKTVISGTVPEGAATVEAVVVRASDGWGVDEAKTISDVVKLQNPDITVPEAVEAVSRLSVDNQEISDVIGDEPSAAVQAAERIVDNAAPSVRYSVTGENAENVTQLVDTVNVKTVGEGWQDKQSVLFDTMPAEATPLEVNVAGRITIADNTIKPEGAWEIAAWTVANLHVPGVIDNVNNPKALRELMANDSVGAIPVEQPDGSFKTVNEIEAKSLGGIEATLPPMPEVDHSLDLTSVPNKPGTFASARFPGVNVTIGQSDGTGKIWVVEGLTPQMMLEPRAREDMGRFLADLAEKASAAGAQIDVGDPALVELAGELMANHYDAQREGAMKVRQGVVESLLVKSGLANNVISDQAAFDAALDSISGGKTFMKDGRTWGFYDPKSGNIYINGALFGTKTGLGVTIHEFAHPAVIATKKINRPLYDRGMELAAKVPLYNQLKSDPAYANMSEETLREEVLVHILQGRLEDIKSQVPAKIYKEIEDFVNQFWRRFGEANGIRDLTPEMVATMTIEDVTDAIGAEMMSGREFGAPRFNESTAKAETEVLRSPGVDGVDPVSGGPRFSIATYEQGGRTTLQNWMAKEVAAKRLSKAEAEDILRETDEVAAIAKKFAGDGKYRQFSQWSEATVEVDENGKPYFGVVRTNGDYAMNIDFSTVCKKRLPMDRIFARLVKDGVLTGANVDELSGSAVAAIQDIIKSHGLEVACPLCFVDAKRYRLGEVSRRFADGGKTSDGKQFIGWNKLVDMQAAGGKAWSKMVANAQGKKDFESRIIRALESDPSTRVKVDASQLISAEGMDKLTRENPGVYELWRSYGGTSHAKDSHSAVPFNNDIFRVVKSRTNPDGYNFDPKKAFAIGGVRAQSFSDYVGRMFFDYVQMFSELAAKKLPMHVYTKEPAFVKLFHSTKAKINMSLVPAVVDDGVAPGLDKNGNYVWADECFPPDQAWKLRKLGSNVGTIAVGVSDQHTLKLLRDDRIDFVIGYHKSGLNPVVAKIRKIDRFYDYTSEQNTRNADGSKYKGDEHFDFYGSLAKTKDPRKTAKEYLKWCDKRGLIPKFDKFRNEKNYYKLLADFRLMDGNGRYAPQEAVVQKYPKNLRKELEASLAEDQAAEDLYLQEENKIVSEIKEQVFGDKKEVYFSRGVPYQGSKSRISPKIIAALPKGERFVDLFSGGGSVTQSAIESGKYSMYLMNDINPVGQRLFLEGVNGKWKNYKRTKMTEAEFAKIKGTPEALAWSFNGLGRNLAKVDSNGRDRAAEQIARVKELEELKAAAKDIESSEVDYSKVELRPGDVVYADIPYSGTDQTAYGRKFDKAKFIKWAQAQKVPVYVSEYSMPEGWTEIMSETVPGMRGGERTEKLFVQSKFADKVRLSRGGGVSTARKMSSDGSEYSYAGLTARSGMKLAQINPESFKNYRTDAERVRDAKDSVLAAGGRKIDGAVVIDMDGSDVVVSSSGIKHRGKKPHLENDMLYPVLGEVLKNAIPVNELAPRSGDKRDFGVKNTFVFLGAFAYKNEICPVRIQVVQKNNTRTLDSVDVLKSLNTKIGKVNAPDKSDLTREAPSALAEFGKIDAPDKSDLTREAPSALAEISIANLIDIAQPLHPEIFSRDVSDALNVTYRGKEINARFARGGTSPMGREVFVAGRARVAEDAERGERLPGVLAASAELSGQVHAPISMAAQMRTVSLPVSEIEWLRKQVTGNVIPTEIKRKLPNNGNAVRSREGKIMLAADVFGLVDKTDMAEVKTQLKANGYFRNEDPLWCSNANANDIALEEKRSEDALADKLIELGDNRVAGREAGGVAAARGVFADQVAQVILDLPANAPGTTGAIRKLGDAFLRNVRGFDAEADSFLNWAYGPASAPRTPRERAGQMLGAFMVMPQEIRNRAPNCMTAIADMITNDPRLEQAWRQLSLRGLSNQAHAQVAQDIEKSFSRAHDEAVAKIVAEGNEPIKPGGLMDQAKENIIVGFSDTMGSVAVRIDARVKAYNKAKRIAIKQATNPADKARLEAELNRFMGVIGQMKNQIELSRTAYERGAWNEDLTYLYKMRDLEDVANLKWGLTESDKVMYLNLKRVIETEGRSGSRGITPRQAQMQLDEMKARLGGAKWQSLENYGNQFHAIIDQDFLSDPRLERMFGKGWVDYCKSQVNYVTAKRTWSQEELDAIELAREDARRRGVAGGDDVVEQMYAYGQKAGAMTDQLVGSMADTADVRGATWEKHMAIKQAVRRNQLVLDLRDALLTAGVEGVRDFRRGESSFPENKRYGHINYLLNGQKRTLIVPREIADGFKVDPQSANLLGTLATIARSGYIDWNPGFRLINNPIYDQSAYVWKMPGARAPIPQTALKWTVPGGEALFGVVSQWMSRKIPGFASLFGKDTIFRYFPEAKAVVEYLREPEKWMEKFMKAEQARDWKKMRELQDVRDNALGALKANMFLPANSRFLAGKSEGFANDVMNAKGIKTTAQREEQELAKSKTRKLLEMINIFKRNKAGIEADDMITKMAAYLHDRIAFGNVRTPQESGVLVKKNIATPDVVRRGKHTRGIQNWVFQFFNAAEKGLEGFYRSAKDNPKGFWSRFSNVFGARLVAALATGGVIWKAMLDDNDGDEEKAKKKYGPLYDYAKWRYRAGQNVSKYMKENYSFTPVWMSGDGLTTISLAGVVSMEDKLITPWADYVAQSFAAKYGLAEDPSAADAVAKSTIKSVVPDMALATPQWKIYNTAIASMWSNPHDAFTDRPYFDKDVWAARFDGGIGSQRFAAEVGMRLWNDLGGRAFYGFDQATPADERNAAPEGVVDVLKKIPVVSPALRRLIKVQVGTPEKRGAMIEEEYQKRLRTIRLCTKELLKAETNGEWLFNSDPKKYDAMKADMMKTYGLDEYAWAEIEAKYINTSNERAYWKDEDLKKYNQLRHKAEKLGMDPADVDFILGDE